MARMRFAIPADTAKFHRVTLPFTSDQKIWVLNSSFLAKFGLILPACPEYAEREMCAWIRENCKGQVHLVQCFTGARHNIVFEFFFPNLTDATMFKLNFCG